MPYIQDITRSHNACFLFLLDQSYGMCNPLSVPGISKAQASAKAINGWIYTTGIACAKNDGVRSYLDIGVIGYRTDQQANPIVGPAFEGALARRELATITEIAEKPAGLAVEIQANADPSPGEPTGTPIQVPIWIEPQAEGGTPLCTALHMAYGILERWIESHSTSLPPSLINITDGESQDGDPTPYADAIKSLSTQHGNVLMFNCHLSTWDSFHFPASDELLPDRYCRILYHLSSVLPIPVANAFDLKPGARGVVFGSDRSTLARFLEVCACIQCPRPPQAILR